MSQSFGLPPRYPVRNHFWRCAEEPCVQASRFDLPLGLLLDAVVADGGGRIERLGDLVLAERSQEPGLDRVRRPHAGVAVGLELRPHGGALRTLPVAADLVQRSEEVLHVVPVLVREDVGLCERTTLGPEPCLELLEEPEVDVDLLVRRAVEGTDVGGRRTAAGARRVGEEHRHGGAISVQSPGPVRLDAVHGPDQTAVPALLGVLAGLALIDDFALLLLSTSRHAVERLEGAQIDVPPAENGDQQDDDDPDDPCTATDSYSATAATAAHAAAVFDLRGVELRPFPEVHGALIPKRLARETRRLGPGDPPATGSRTGRTRQA